MGAPLSPSTSHTGALEERVADLERQLREAKGHVARLERLAKLAEAGITETLPALRNVVGLLIATGNAVSLAADEADDLTRAQLLDTAIASVRAARDLLGGAHAPPPRAVPPGGAA